MSLYLSIPERLTRMRADFRAGVPIILCDGNQHFLIAAIETLTQRRLQELAKMGGEVVLTKRRAQALKITAYDGDVARLALPKDAKIDWVRSLADPSDDLKLGLRGPFATLRGNADIQSVAITLVKQAQLLPALIVVPIKEPIKDLHCADISEVEENLQSGSPLQLVSFAPVPLAASQDSRVYVYRPLDGGVEHYAIEIGSPDRDEPVLSRLHSACFTGDLMGSLKCDCGAQLQAALHAIAENGSGVLLYMNQEGRGIGLANKMRAYSLQAAGFDTVEANHRLGFEDDERDFRLGAEILREMGFGSVRLMTNNPKKLERMASHGLQVVERVPLQVGENPLNKHYLATKAAKSGHML